MSKLNSAERDIVILAMNYVISFSSGPCTQEKELLARLHEDAKAPTYSMAVTGRDQTAHENLSQGSARRLPEVTFPDLDFPEPPFVSYRHCNCPGCGR